MDYDIYITPLAEMHLDGIAGYFVNDLQVPETAKVIVQGIRTEISKLRYQPARHELYHDPYLAARQIRRHYYKNYIIFYRIREEEKAVDIVAILHTLVDSRSLLYRVL